MKTFNIIAKKDDNSQKIAARIKRDLESELFVYNEQDFELLISIGGDGTILKAIHTYMDRLDKILLCGVHTGTLGFYTDFLVNEVDELIEKIIKQEFEIVEFNMLKVEIQTNKANKILYALNEARLENNRHTQVMDVFINDEYFETFRGNGLNFASPTGSTGYNKSLGGAIVHPLTKSMQMSEIASINNINYRSLNSSLILDYTHQVKVELKGDNGVVLGYDSYSLDLSESYANSKSLIFSLSDKTVRFARYKKLAFMNRVKKNFIFDDI